MDHLGHLDTLKRPLRVLRAGILRELRDLEAPALLGFRSLAALVETELDMSERAVRDLIREMDCLEDDPLLAWAFESGRVGMGQALLLSRVAAPETRDAWIARAETVTHAQLEREVRLLRRARWVVPGLDTAQPFPVEVESQLRERLVWRGWTDAELEARLPRIPVSTDPAEDPRVLARLEVLLDILDLDLMPEVGDRREVGPAPHLPHRQMLSTPRTRTIVLQLPDLVRHRWTEVQRRVRAARGPLPPWAVLTLLCQAALEVWLRWDPVKKPARFAILERDGWRCQAPGCEARRNLEVHHIIFRSQNGTDTQGNQVTLCHGHHRRGIHEGRARLEGAAPGHLLWRLGRAESRHAEKFHGHRRVK